MPPSCAAAGLNANATRPAETISDLMRLMCIPP
jgi:hypothetical protein